MLPGPGGDHAGQERVELPGVEGQAVALDATLVSPDEGPPQLAVAQPQLVRQMLGEWRRQTQLSDLYCVLIFSTLKAITTEEYVM